MKKVREAQEDGPAQDAEGSERRECGPLREREVTLAKERRRLRTAEVRRRRAEVRGRTTGGRGQDKGDVETRAKGRATSAERTMHDAIGPIPRSEGRLMLEDGPQQNEKVTSPNANVRRSTGSGPFPFEEGRAQDTRSRPTVDERPPRCAKSSAVARFRPTRSAKRSASGARARRAVSSPSTTQRWGPQCHFPRSRLWEASSAALPY
jgi:hypothetical protein